MQFPMFTIPVETLLKMTTIEPHEELQAGPRLCADGFMGDLAATNPQHVSTSQGSWGEARRRQWAQTHTSPNLDSVRLWQSVNGDSETNALIFEAKPKVPKFTKHQPNYTAPCPGHGGPGISRCLRPEHGERSFRVPSAAWLHAGPRMRGTGHRMRHF